MVRGTRSWYLILVLGLGLGLGTWSWSWSWYLVLGLALGLGHSLVHGLRLCLGLGLGTWYLVLILVLVLVLVLSLGPEHEKMTFFGLLQKGQRSKLWGNGIYLYLRLSAKYGAKRTSQKKVIRVQSCDFDILAGEIDTRTLCRPKNT